MAVIKNAVMNGAQLIQALAKSGTGDNKLELVRMHLAFINRKEKRIANAAEIIDIMEKAGVTDALQNWPRTPELTLRKAIALATTGVWEGVEAEAEKPVEEVLLAGAELPPEEMKSVEEELVDDLDERNRYEMQEELGLKRTPKKKPAKTPKKQPKSAAQTVTVAETPEEAAAG